MLIKTITPFQAGIKSSSITNYKNLSSYKSESALFTWDAKLEVSPTEIKVYGWVINSSDKALSLVLDGFGLTVALSPNLTYIGPDLPPAPPLPYWIEVPAKTKLELTNRIYLENYKYDKAQAVEVYVSLSDAFEKLIGATTIAVKLTG